MPTRAELRPFALVAALHFVLTLAFVARVPLGHAPDETSHLDYVRHLVERRALPVLGAEGVTYEAHQPPLYYVLCLPAFVAAQSFGLDGEIVACRLVSALLGLLNLAFIWLGAREVFRDDRMRPLLAAAFCAVLPMNLYVNAACGNDVLAGLLASATLWWLLRGCGVGFDERSAVITGALAGAAVWAKMNALFLAPLGALTLFVWSQRERLGTPRAVRLGGLVVLTALVIAAPWLLRNSYTYGDPLALRAFKQFFNNPSPSDMMTAFGLSPVQYVGKVAVLTACTFFGLFGEVNSAIVRMKLFDDTPPAVYALLLILVGFFIVPSAKVLRFRPRLRQPVELRWWLLAVSCFLICLTFVQFNLSYFQAQARYLHMALGSIAIAWAAGSRAGSFEMRGRTREGAEFVRIGDIGRVIILLLVVIALLDLTLWQPILLPGGKVVTRSLL